MALASTQAEKQIIAPVAMAPKICVLLNILITLKELRRGETRTSFFEGHGEAKVQEKACFSHFSIRETPSTIKGLNGSRRLHVEICAVKLGGKVVRSQNASIDTVSPLL